MSADSRLNTDLSKVVSLSNGVSVRRLEEILMENERYVAFSGVRKYKRRKVSAVRDFPPGCGWFPTQINLTPGEEAGYSGTIEKSVNGDESCGSLHVDCDRSSATGNESQSQDLSLMVGQRDHMDSVGEKLMNSSNQVDGLESVKAESTGTPLLDLEPGHVEKSVLKLENGGNLNASEVLNKVDLSAKEEIAPKGCLKSFLPLGEPVISHGIYLNKSSIRNYPPRRNVSAVRDFPPNVGINASHLTSEEIIEIVASVQNKNSGPEKYCNGDVTMKADFKQIRQAVLDEDNRKSRVEGDDVSQIGEKVQPESDGIFSKERGKNKEFKILPEEDKLALGDAKEQSDTSGKTNTSRLHLETESLEKTDEKSIGLLEENMERQIVIYSRENNNGRRISDTTSFENKLQDESSGYSEFTSGRVLVLGLMAAKTCPWRQGRKVTKRNVLGGAGERKEKNHDFILQPQKKPAQKVKDSECENSGKICSEKNLNLNNEGSLGHDEESRVSQMDHRSHSVSLLPSVPGNSGGRGDDNDAIATRNQVRETLRLFHLICRKLLQEEEARPQERLKGRRIDYEAAKILKNKRKYVNTGKQIIGSVPGVDIGDEFHYRVELNIIGLHRPTQGGIDYVKEGGKLLATSIVASGGYDDELDNSDVLIYTGQGGNVMKVGDKEPEDQKLERGNLALTNSKHAHNPVRVIRGEMKASDSSDSKSRTYIYDGLYEVVELWQEQGSHGKLVFKFKLVRLPGQPELAWKVVKKSKTSKVREGVCVNDISNGKELIPICAVNTIDDEKPPSFEYVTGMIYPDWCNPTPPKGCDCTNGCSESGKCLCISKNGGEIPFNHNGAIVEAKALVYECGPPCKCPPSCYNRVSQQGIKFQLEIF
ncbi:LOW QUALITY PROTEIN: histone-lysine N-methyltransferase, H3 lysine-9 specific SUVH6-like, partial [Carica papaya]|uniref:LOW QUALITY PROTEIN: histone-lysine N-methyltransferase, H3 lysine-9 specific SUVH6-like n=1 Tax=Carica papaya TaxID=3649 RepID=UPI000B8CB971